MGLRYQFARYTCADARPVASDDCVLHDLHAAEALGGARRMGDHRAWIFANERRQPVVDRLASCGYRLLRRRVWRSVALRRIDAGAGTAIGSRRRTMSGLRVGPLRCCRRAAACNTSQGDYKADKRHAHAHWLCLSSNLVSRDDFQLGSHVVVNLAEKPVRVAGDGVPQIYALVLWSIQRIARTE